MWLQFLDPQPEEGGQRDVGMPAQFLVVGEIMQLKTAWNLEARS